MQQPLSSRRTFVKSAAMAASGIIIVPRHVLGGSGYIPPSDKVNIGIVGAGGKGRENTLDLLALPDVQVTAIADPAEYWDLSAFYYQSEAGRGPVKQLVEAHFRKKQPAYKVAEYLDFRKMLEKEKNLDAIVCATPDHTHAYISLIAMRQGKHVYCEKPLTHNIWEARLIKKVAKETGVATQMGNNGHSTDGIRQTVEYLQAGAIGKVQEVHAWVPATRWIPSLKGMPQENAAPPQGFDWDLWLGPREKQAFHQAFVPVTWRDFWRFGCGALGDFGCHDMDAAAWAFNLQTPDSVEIYPAGYSDADITPYGEIGYYRFSAKGQQPAMQLNWYSGGLKPAKHAMLPENYQYASRSTMFVGDKGLLIHEGSDRIPKLFPESLRTSFKAPAPSIPRSKGHHRDWVDAIKGGPAASANFDYSATLTELTLLGVLSLRLGGKKINWNADKMQATGLPEAEAIIREPIRQGWEMA